MIKYIPIEDFEALWSDLSSRRCITSPSLDPRFKRITVYGLSGEGERFASEYDRMMHEHFNPPMPQEIQMNTLEGVTTYRVGSK